MDKNNEKKTSIKMSLPQIIKKNTQKDVTFLELERAEKAMVFNYVKSNKIKIKIFGYRWFDILSKKFYVIEYKQTDENIFGFCEEEKPFDSFEDFFKSVDGDIYQNSCFYGYNFSEYEIKTYHINLELINFDSLLHDDIDAYSFESITRKNLDEAIEKRKTVDSIVRWFEKREPALSFTDLETYYKKFIKRFTFWEAKDVFFSMIIRRDKELIKESVCQFACKYDTNDGASFDKVLLTYGRDAALFVIDNFDGKCSYDTRKRRKRRFRDSLEGYDEGTFHLSRSLGFNFALQLYYVEDRYENRNNYPIRNREYFTSFDEFVENVDGDLCGADLSRAPIDEIDVLKYKTNQNTKFPTPKKYAFHSITKAFIDDYFIVEQKWYDPNESTILKDKHEFCRFFDFVHFLKGDLSNSDLLFCEGIENIATLHELKLDKVKVRSDIAEKLGLEITLLPDVVSHLKEFEESEKNELQTLETLLADRTDDDDLDKISYITDIHLLHRFEAYKCRTQEDVDYVIRKIAKTIGESASIVNLIGGDTSSDFGVFQKFVNNLSIFRRMGDFFFVLGNHELWGMGTESLSSIISKYKLFLDSKANGRMHLVHNNLFYRELNVWKEMSEEDLFKLSIEEIRSQTRSADLLIFGGVGFAGMSEEFNANDGIYEDVLDREGEKTESTKFLTLYEKITNSLKGRNLIILSHMPMKDWGGSDIHAKEGLIYVNGHSHRNYFYDDGRKRIYADNQIGYRGKKLSLKHILVDCNYDWFSDYNDGIYEITKEDYEHFYRGIRESIDFNRKNEKIYMLKRQGTYMFLLEHSSGNLMVLNGGAIKKAGNHPLDYFYDNLCKYSNSVKMFLSKYENLQKQISNELKSIEADGTIHGCIVDIDFYNHLYINPLDGTITPYYATSIVDKYVYNNFPSLLKYKCPKLYQNYQKRIELKNSGQRSLLIVNNKLEVSNHRTFVSDTEMYRISRIIRGLQFTTKYNVVRLWNDTLVGDPTEENGRLIVSGMIYPEPITNQKDIKTLLKKKK